MLSDDEKLELARGCEGHVEFADRIIAAYTAKLLEGVEMPEPVAEIRLNMTGGNAGLSTHIVQVAGGYFPAKTKLFTADQLQQYAAAAAAQARMKALDEAKGVCMTVAEVALCTNKGEMARKTSATAESCAKAIESLKGKQA